MVFFFFKQKTAYEMRISDWSSDVCSSDLLIGYYGSRGIVQYLSIPPGPQGNPTHSGGVIDLGTDYGGSEARWRYRGGDAERPWSIVAGLSRSEEHTSELQSLMRTSYAVFCLK